MVEDLFFQDADTSAFPHPSGSVAFTPRNETALGAAFAKANAEVWKRNLFEFLASNAA